MHSGFFLAEQAPAEWAAYPWLARICERSALTRVQAEVAYLYVVRKLAPQAAAPLVQVSPAGAQSAFDAANRRIGQRYPQLRVVVTTQTAVSAEVLEVMLHRSSAPRGPLIMGRASGELREVFPPRLVLPGRAEEREVLPLDVLREYV